MARPLRIEYPGAVYHVMNRGNQRATVFHDDWHYAMFLDKLENFADEFNVVVYTYCCMPNHFHLQLRTKEANLSRFMQSFLTSFSISSNKKRHTSGHIFQGRFKSQLVEDDLYRSRLSRYIHLNPVRIRSLRDTPVEDRRCSLRDFRWSSYRVYLGTEKKPGWLDRSRILSCWGKKLRNQMLSYAEYVEEGLVRAVDNPFDDIIEQSILGGDRFIDRIKREYLLLRSGNKGDEPALVRLQESFDFEKNRVAPLFHSFDLLFGVHCVGLFHGSSTSNRISRRCLSCNESWESRSDRVSRRLVLCDVSGQTRKLCR